MKNTLAQALEQRGYTKLTPVQEAVTEADLIGADLLVSAQTGSGKTLGFGLAIAPTLLREAEVFEQAAAPLALIIAPTRELALQVKRELSWLYAQAGAVLASCVGGMDMRDERRALGRGAHIVVATPGRLRDHIMRGSIDLSALRAVVLDEADEMLDLGFREDLEFILGAAPEDRQTMMFSATVPAAIAKLAKSYQKDAVRVSTKAETSQHADIDYRAMPVAARDTDNAIINVLRYFEAPNAIVFCNTRAMVGRLTTRLSNRGFSVVALSGELTQSERTNALQAMRDGRARICVATDVAARGIDLPNLDLVVHADLPSSHETLLHRSGRTGRAGRKGTSALIVPPVARKKAERILKFAKLTATWAAAPSAEDVRAQDSARMLADPAWEETLDEGLQETADQLVERFTPQQLAGAYLKLLATRQTAPEELSAVDAKPEPRAPFGPSVWFSLSGGRNAGAEPRRLLPMICTSGGLGREEIGAIRIQQDESYIEIKADSVETFLQNVGSAMTIEGGAALRQLDSPPAGARSGPGPKSGHKSGPHSGPRSGPRQGGKPGGKPRYKDKPKYDEKPVPRHEDSGPAPAPKDAAKPKGTTKPVEWNDDPAPRQRKPKPGAKPGGGKPGGKKPGPPKRDYDGAVTAHVPRQGGPTPPPGKPSSKKNRARAAAAGAGEGPSAMDPSARMDGKRKGKPFGKPGGKPSGKPGGKPSFKAGKPGGNSPPKRKPPARG